MPNVIAEATVASAYNGKADDTGFLDHGGAGVGAGGYDNSLAMHARAIVGEFIDLPYFVAAESEGAVGKFSVATHDKDPGMQKRSGLDEDARDLPQAERTPFVWRPRENP